jgi:hypothetical protein
VADFSADEQDALFRRNAIVTYDMGPLEEHPRHSTGSVHVSTLAHEDRP